MTTLEELVVPFKGNTRQFEKAVNRSTSLVEKFSKSMKQMLAIAGVGAGVGFGIRLAAQAEKAEVAFGVLLKSADRAKVAIQQLRSFSAATPFEFGDVQVAARHLLVADVAAKDLTTTLRRLGDISAVTDTRLSDLASVFAKAKARDIIQGDTLELFRDRGLPIEKELSKVLGVEVSQVRKLASESKIVFADLNQAFINMTKRGGQFFEGTSKLADTAAGKWSTLKDNFKNSAQELGLKVLPTITKAIESMTRVLQGAREALAALRGGDQLRRGLVPIGGKLIDANSDIVRREFLERDREINRRRREGTLNRGQPILTRRDREAIQNRLKAQGNGKFFVLQDMVRQAKELDAARKADMEASGRLSGAIGGGVSQGIGAVRGAASGIAGIARQLGTGLGAFDIGKLMQISQRQAVPMGLNTAVTAGSREAMALAAMNQQRHQQEQIQVNQLNVLQAIEAQFREFIGTFTQQNQENGPEATTGAL